MKCYPLQQISKALKSKGFSLVETIIALAIFVIIASLTIPIVHFFKQQQVAGEAYKLYLHIMMLHHKSQLPSANPSNIIINVAQRSYQDDACIEQLDNNVLFAFLPNAFGPPSSPTNHIQEAITFKDNTIIFEQNGFVNAGTIYMTDKAKNYMYAITIGVAKKIFIRLYVYKNKKWILLH